MIPDIDGVRLITNDVCEFLQKVPGEMKTLVPLRHRLTKIDVTEEVFKLGSTSPASVLLDSVDQLEKGSPKADENIQLIKSDLADAVQTCVQAAGQEFTIHWQKKLLKAASFGKSMVDFYNSDEFVELCERLRILNAVRDYRIGLPISSEQYTYLTPEKLIQRLINRHEYLLAIRISDYLHLPADRVYVHWASQKVKVSTADDDEICALIVERLNGKGGISFESIARAAHDEGRTRLATELLDHEPRAGKQVPLLLSMEEDEVALDKAIESGDTDLIYYVLLHLKKKLPLASFFRTINTRPIAAALVETSALAQDTELLKDFYYQDDRRLDGSNLLFSEALIQAQLQTKIDKLRLASRLLSDTKDPNALLHQKAHTEATQLLKAQEAFDKDIGEASAASGSSSTTFTGMSLNQTIYTLIRSGYTKRAQKLQSDFKVLDKTYWWIRLRALVAKRDWGELEDISKLRKSPINWEPFFNEILGAGNTKLASVFIPKCTGSKADERMEMWVKCGMMGKAAEEAYKAKDYNSLEDLRGKATGAAAVEVERFMGMLRPRR